MRSACKPGAAPYTPSQSLAAPTRPAPGQQGLDAGPSSWAADSQTFPKKRTGPGKNLAGISSLRSHNENFPNFRDAAGWACECRS